MSTKRSTDSEENSTSTSSNTPGTSSANVQSSANAHSTPATTSSTHYTAVISTLCPSDFDRWVVHQITHNNRSFCDEDEAHAAFELAMYREMEEKTQRIVRSWAAQANIQSNNPSRIHYEEGEDDCVDTLGHDLDTVD